MKTILFATLVSIVSMTVSTHAQTPRPAQPPQEETKCYALGRGKDIQSILDVELRATAQIICISTVKDEQGRQDIGFVNFLAVSDKAIHPLYTFIGKSESARCLDCTVVKAHPEMISNFLGDKKAESVALPPQVKTLILTSTKRDAKTVSIKLEAELIGAGGNRTLYEKLGVSIPVPTQFQK